MLFGEAIVKLNDIFLLFLDAESFEPGESSKKPAVLDKWEGEDEDDDVRVS